MTRTTWSRTALLAVIALAALAASGCEDKTDDAMSDEPQLGLGPGESVAYDDSAAPPPPSGAMAYDDPAPIRTTTPAPADSMPVEAVGPTRPIPEPTPRPTPVTQTPPATTTRTMPPARSAVPQTYTIRRGDTLINLARRFYNDESKWKAIWNANRNTIKDPNRIMPGQTITLP